MRLFKSKRKFTDAFDYPPPPYQHSVKHLKLFHSPGFKHDIFIWDKAHLWQSRHLSDGHDTRGQYLGEGRFTATRVLSDRERGASYLYQLEFDALWTLNRFILKWEVTESSHVEKRTDKDGQSYLCCHSLSVNAGLDDLCISLSRGIPCANSGRQFPDSHYTVSKQDEAIFSLFVSGAKQNIVPSSG